MRIVFTLPPPHSICQRCRLIDRTRFPPLQAHTALKELMQPLRTTESLYVIKSCEGERHSGIDLLYSHILALHHRRRGAFISFLIKQTSAPRFLISCNVASFMSVWPQPGICPFVLPTESPDALGEPSAARHRAIAHTAGGFLNTYQQSGGGKQQSLGLPKKRTQTVLISILGYLSVSICRGP
ncbi:hypothetical protein SKAU_G00374300 [Synaphobranchus kaupii]|uniref:Uncharacterized protein n=1 Tax=Synaphobranchus kaupii TaxID=118154 RepID=A0A9Q1EGP2_SYNKA|nr:hypothetical protein SKAU_G00374300 [Synaphobranchus kaupii]